MRTRWHVAVVVVAAMVWVPIVGCGDGGPAPGKRVAARDVTWRPSVTDPGGDLFAYDDVDVATGASPRAEAAIRTVLADLDVATLRDLSLIHI